MNAALKLKPAASHTSSFVPHKLFTAIALAAAALLGSAAHAMDARYQDKDGDLVADAPTDSKEWVDPSTLVFAYTPVEDPAVYAKVWDGFIQHMSKVTGKKVQFFPVQSNAAQLEAMRAGRLHVAGFNTGSNPLAVNCAGFVPFTMMVSKDDKFGYEMEIITHPGSGIEKVEDIRGKRMAFTSETSNSGYKAPSALLRDQFKMEADKDYTPMFSGKHDNSILGVANKDYPAAAVANSVKQRMEARGTVKPEQFNIIYKSQTFPTTGYGYAHNLKPELAEKVKEAFFTFEWEGSDLAKEFNTAQPPQEKFMPITYKEYWQVVRDIDRAMGVAYTCK
ncbi:phosphate/phosphite/phosphonate ABC transporter substrate-binding protein [Eoetvoesiella caeni]|uniref:Phosphonate transport system substrate-binding protein n=1 Tax=Eoetvoesiella caeni TaxID=645616 RepID=A0A366HCV6_9BURK|nr:phosphate/phosphite/phosphonate ABC transporter substrate-binding protein [Eoetvoesiella caeni]MCI2808828.1 phosphate/phosphite/phosphonate ABC transporter substrate-binding protein [Eoetvoesiella caeni]NYT55672.1 phosphate/phosphite/phosphonate ABC transporter substrate-binding protein [Eoetvoesiella caeni]RBP40230.1 phosphonate transport system substrate-binding protein [Eoetvoesiella caeni]